MRTNLLQAALCFVVGILSVSPGVSAEITVERSDAGAVVKIDGKLFTEYHTQSGAKPILWPIIGPTGKPMTRAYPMAEAAGEKKDHPHQRSLWFTHGDVGGVSFWEEAKGRSGTIKHREFVKVEGGKRPTIITRNDWLKPDGVKACEDVRTLRFGTDDDARWIDFDIAIQATEGPVRFGDTKEGSFGVRVAETLSVDAKRGGRIVNSSGHTDDKAWGKRAAWVAYHGPIDGEICGVAILNHPQSFRYPTYWHVRNYGLFAANPFGAHDFEGGRGDGAYVLPAGERLIFRYRVLLHRGDEKSSKIFERFKAYSEEVF